MIFSLFSRFLYQGNYYKCIFLFFLMLASFQLTVKSQNTDNLGNVRVEELTDEQIRNFILELERLGIKNEQIQQLALQRGMSPVELAKLKDRIQAGRKAMNAGYDPLILQKKPSADSRIQDSISAAEQNPVKDFNTAFASLRSSNFGFEVFNNPKITFEPNLRLPTPKNYTLAADDELLIDVSGYSEANYKLKVSPEGLIRIPLAGAINVNGLTIEQASRIITKKLASTLYYNIKTGNTFVDVSLGAIRSIKVTIIGEASVPGTYTLPSLASAFNALYACGGSNYNGTLRNIQVIRNNVTVSTIDVYGYLLNGDKKNDIRLMDEDIIKINTYTTRIELKGEVKKPGLYDVVKGETLGEILQYAGGFTDNAYTAKILVFKNTDRDRQVTNFSEAELDNVVPQKGDNYIVGKINNRFSNRISLKGAVNRPGEYELKTGMTLSQLINDADGVREDAFINRGTIHRLKDDLSPEIISFDLEKLLAGKVADIALKKEDRVNIFSKFDLKEGYYVKIEGEVVNPGVFLYEEGITAEDLVMMAGGFKESASGKRIEISRRMKNADSTSLSTTDTKTAVIYQKDINADLKDSSGTDKLVLKPFDEVSVYRAPGYFEQKNVVIEGEVIYAGKYSLEAKNDRISDLIRRSGGMTPEAYLKGAVLVRSKKLSKTEQANQSQGITNLLKQNYTNGAPEALLQFELERTLNKTSESIGIELEEILDNPKSEYDLFLNDGDTLRIPKQLQTVRVNGEVLYPTLVRYNEDYKFKDYVIGAGGYSDRSSRRRSYAVYPNGAVKGTKSFLFFRSYPKIAPGTEIYVPTKREKERLRTGEIISIGATLTTLLLVTYSILRK
jgi:protein involved in polysaccharide export with SLBB domain